MVIARRWDEDYFHLTFLSSFYKILICTLRKKIPLFAEQKQTHRLCKQTYGYQRGRVGGVTGGIGLAYAY